MSQPIRFGLRRCLCCRAPFADGFDWLCCLCGCPVCWPCVEYVEGPGGQLVYTCRRCRNPPRGPSALARDGRPLFAPLEVPTS